MFTSNTLVIRNDNDSECPTIGKVIGWEDEDRCLVLWGDAQYSNDKHRARVESADELIPYASRR